MPGYGWSEKPSSRGFNQNRVAETLHQLMLALGYGDGYYAQGGDWGAGITRDLGVMYPDVVRAIHTNMPSGARPKGFDRSTLTPDEVARIVAGKEFGATGAGYQAIQSTKPTTLSFGLVDSPVGVAAWILEKMAAWSENDGTLADTALSMDEMLTNIMIYWLTKTAGSSARLYYESMAVAPGTTAPAHGR